MDREQLAQLKRAELQKLSKDEGLKANLKTEALLDALEAHYASNPTRRPSQPLRAATNTPLPPSDETTNTTDRDRDPSASENPKPRRAPSRSQTAKQIAPPSQAAKQTASSTQPPTHPQPPSQSQTQAVPPSQSAPQATHAEEDMQNAPQPLPRTRKAKETQLRLGVGRPKLIGGTGARATNPKPVAAPVRASRRKTPAVEQQQQQGVQDAPTVSISPPEEAGRENQSQSQAQRTAPSNVLALETIREHASGEGAEGQEMPAVPIVPIDVTPALSAASSSNSNSVSHGSPLSVASSTTPHATDARVATLESRVGVLEAQNAMLLARVAALEERETGRLASTTVGGPSSPALSIPQSARIRSDTSSLVPRSARVRSDASQQSMASVASLSRPASARRVSGMPSPRRTSLAVQPSASWMTGAATTIVEEDEGSSSASGGIPVPMEVAIAMQQQQQPSPPMQFSPPATSTTGMQAPQQSMQQQHSPYDPMQNMGLPPNMQFNPAPPQQQLHYPNLTYAPSPPQQLPLWASALPPHVVPSAAGPSALGKHARDSAPSSPAMPSSESRPPPRKKPRLESTLGHGVPPHMRRMQQQQHPQEVDLDPEPLVSINKSFGGAAAPQTPPRAGPVQVPVPETPLTAAYGATLAALFRGPREEDIPEEERSPEKKTLYGTERSNDTRFGEFGWGWR